MVFPMILLKIAVHLLLSFYRKTSRKIRNYGFLHRNPSRTLPKCPSESRELAQTILVSEFHSTLLRTTSPFPYFMLVAFEGGSLLRALLLLLSFPLLCALGFFHTELSIRTMAFIAFCGLRVKNMELVARAVLPKFYLENLHSQAFEVLMAAKGRRVVFSSLPKVMVEGFLKEYLGVDEVVGAELKVVRKCYFSGLVCGSVFGLKQQALWELFGETKVDMGLLSTSHDHIFFPYCKETYVVSKEDRSMTPTTLPRNKYPKPLIFHDSRLAFLPTPLSTISLFLFLPLSIPLSVLRILLGVLPPYNLIFLLGALTGTRFRVRNLPNCTKTGGTLYVCTHRTLVDPVMLSTALSRPVTAVTYSLSPLTEAIAPMRTVRLTRDRNSDSDTMRKLLKEGDLTVCPEGTTCREPYLLRFSPLFAEVADEIVPVAMDARGSSWFYGTTASGWKWLDPVFFFMNPMPGYRVEFLERVPREMSCAAGWSGTEVANRIQRRLGEVLGFECTGLTRKDKYRMLAGNEGVVKRECK